MALLTAEQKSQLVAFAPFIAEFHQQADRLGKLSISLGQYVESRACEEGMLKPTSYHPLIGPICRLDECVKDALHGIEVAAEEPEEHEDDDNDDLSFSTGVRRLNMSVDNLELWSDRMGPQVIEALRRRGMVKTV